MCLAPFYVLTNFSVDNIIKSNWPLLKNKEKGSLIILLFFLSISISLFLMLPTIKYSGQIFFYLLNTKWYALNDLLPFMLLSVIYIIPKEIFNSWSIVENKLSLNKNINLLYSILTTCLILVTSIISKDYIIVIKVLVYGRALIGVIQIIIILFNIEKIIIQKLNIKIIKQGLPLYIASIFNNITPRFNSFLITSYFNISMLAYYNISYAVLNIYNELLEHFNNSTDSYIYESNDSNNIISKNLVFIYTMWSYSIITISSFYMLFGNKFINTVSNGLFHDSFNFGVLIFAIIIMRLPFLGNQQILIKYGKEKTLMALSIFKAFSIITYSFFLIPILGAKGILVSVWICNLGFDLIIWFLKNKYKKTLLVKISVIYFSIIYHLSIFSYFYFREIDFHTYYYLIQLIIVTKLIIGNRKKIYEHIKFNL